MNTRFVILAAACTLALAGCGNKPAPPADTMPATPPAAETQPVPAEAPVETPAPMAEAPAADTKAAVVSNCATQIDANDAMKYDVDSITVPASCKDFTINLKHVGTMPVAAMGHNVVITKLSDVTAVDSDGMSAGVAGNYVKADDARVIAHTKLVGGGESTSVTFAVSKIKDGGPYEFFCSFPGHQAAGMKGSIQVQ